MTSRFTLWLVFSTVLIWGIHFDLLFFVFVDWDIVEIYDIDIDLKNQFWFLSCFVDWDIGEIDDIGIDLKNQFWFSWCFCWLGYCWYWYWSEKVCSSGVPKRTELIRNDHEFTPHECNNTFLASKIVNTDFLPGTRIDHHLRLARSQSGSFKSK